MGDEYAIDVDQGGTNLCLAAYSGGEGFRETIVLPTRMTELQAFAPAHPNHIRHTSSKPKLGGATRLWGFAFLARIAGSPAQRLSTKTSETTLRSVEMCVSALLAMGFLSGCAAFHAKHLQTAPPFPTYLQNSKDAVQTLQTWYEPSTGLYRTTGWWNSANAITVLVDYARVSKLTEYNPIFANTYIAAQKTSPGFLNKFYDDEGWWALAWIDAYDLTRNRDYLAMAESIFADMGGAWDNTCGGGIWWSKDKNYKNAIANELFLSVAAHLVNRTSGSARKHYKEWGNREWKWFKASGMINSKNLINDGLKESPGQGAGLACTNNGRTTWTYNQGVVLGGLAELSSANHDPALRQSAGKIATAAITQLVDSSGILHDPCEPKCGADGVQFKGIFVRNLVLLNKSIPQAAYASFVEKNADTLWREAHGPSVQLSERWSGPFDSANAASQSSALDALVGASTLSAKVKVKGL